MKWLNEPASWQRTGDVLSVSVDPGTDFWRETGYGYIHDSGHVYGEEHEGDVDVTVCVRGAFGSQYDQAGIMLRIEERVWLKTGVEFFEGRPRLSTVLTLGRSSWMVTDLPDWMEEITLRASRRGDAVEVRYLVAGGPPELAALVYLPPGRAVLAGIMCAAPEGPGFRVSFSDLLIERGWSARLARMAAERRDEAVAEQHDEAATEQHDEPVTEQLGEAAAGWRDEAVTEQLGEAAAGWPGEADTERPGEAAAGWPGEGAADDDVGPAGEPGEADTLGGAAAPPSETDPHRAGEPARNGAADWALTLPKDPDPRWSDLPSESNGSGWLGEAGSDQETRWSGGSGDAAETRWFGEVPQDAPAPGDPAGPGNDSAPASASESTDALGSSWSGEPQHSSGPVWSGELRLDSGRLSPDEPQRDSGPVWSGELRLDSGPLWPGTSPDDPARPPSAEPDKGSAAEAPSKPSDDLEPLPPSESRHDSGPLPLDESPPDSGPLSAGESPRAEQQPEPAAESGGVPPDLSRESSDDITLKWLAELREDSDPLWPKQPSHDSGPLWPAASVEHSPPTSTARTTTEGPQWPKSRTKDAASDWDRLVAGSKAGTWVPAATPDVGDRWPGPPLLDIAAREREIPDPRPVPPVESARNWAQPDGPGNHKTPPEDSTELAHRTEDGASRRHPPPIDLPPPPDPADEWISLLTADPAEE